MPRNHGDEPEILVCRDGERVGRHGDDVRARERSLQRRRRCAALNEHIRLDAFEAWVVGEPAKTDRQYFVVPVVGHAEERGVLDVDLIGKIVERGIEALDARLGIGGEARQRTWRDGGVLGGPATRAPGRGSGRQNDKSHRDPHRVRTSMASRTCATSSSIDAAVRGPAGVSTSHLVERAVAMTSTCTGPR